MLKQEVKKMPCRLCKLPQTADSHAVASLHIDTNILLCSVIAFKNFHVGMHHMDTNLINIAGMYRLHHTSSSPKLV
jgi:hypothetical protein